MTETKIIHESSGVQAARELAGHIANIDTRLSRASRASQAAHRSIEAGSLDVYDQDGELRASIGVLDDGTVGVRAVNAVPPPRPSAPTARPVVTAVEVSWDGTWDDADLA